jgi:hypothetical protein
MDMDTIVKKTCNGCGIDVTQQKRVKDQQGHYFCHQCWSGKQVAGTSPSNPLPSSTVKAPAPPAVLPKTTNQTATSALMHKDLADTALARTLAGPWFIILTVAGVVFQIVWPFATDIGEGGLLVSAFIIITSVCIAIDAAIARTPMTRKKPYHPLTNGWLRWLAGSLWLWIFVAPYYLFARLNKLNKSPQQAGHGQMAATDLEIELRKLKQLVVDGLLTEDDFLAQKRALLGHGGRPA